MAYIKYIEQEEIDYYQDTPDLVRKRAYKIINIFNSNKDKKTKSQLARLIANSITNKKASHVIYRELSVLHNSFFTKSEIVNLACSVSGSVKTAARYGIAGICSPQVKEIDVWAVVKDIFKVTNLRDEIEYQYKLIICNSVLAGSSILVTIHHERVRWWAYKLGLLGSGRFEKLSYNGPQQLFDANMILRAKRVDNQLVILGASSCKATAKSNRTLAYRRDRSKSKCFYGANWHCAKCDIGRNECTLSCSKNITNVLSKSKVTN